MNFNDAKTPTTSIKAKMVVNPRSKSDVSAKVFPVVSDHRVENRSARKKFIRVAYAKKSEKTTNNVFTSETCDLVSELPARYATIRYPLTTDRYKVNVVKLASRDRKSSEIISDSVISSS